MPLHKIGMHVGFKDGIYFSCQKCGNCCKGLDSGEIYLYQRDVKKIFKSLNLRSKEDKSNFAKHYFKIVEDCFSYRKKIKKTTKKSKFNVLSVRIEDRGEEKCIFLNNDNNCQIYSARPFQCRSFPFWNILVTDKNEFLSYKRTCPALCSNIRNSKLISSKKIENILKKEYILEKRYFKAMKRKNFDITRIYSFLRDIGENF